MRRAAMWLRAVLTRHRLDKDLAREMALHIDLEREKLEREGVPPETALRRAKLAFGGEQRFAEAVIDERGTRPLSDMVHDVRYAFRQVKRAPVLNATIVAMLALGIGANSFLFAVLETVTMRPPAGVASHRTVVRIRGLASTPGRPAGPRSVSYQELSEYRAQSSVFAAVGGWMETQVAVTPPGDLNPVTRYAQFVTGDFYRALGLRPTLGTLPASFRDDGADGSAGVVVSHRFWMRHLGGAPDAIGKPLRVGDATHVIVGVAPRGFAGAHGNTGVPAWLWLPISALGTATGHAGPSPGRDGVEQFQVVARLQPRVSLKRANATARAVGERAQWTRESAVGARTAGNRVTFSSDVVTLRADNARPNARGDARTIIAFLGAITLLILAIVCTSVSGLLLGRAVARRREIGVRLSLGASRARLVRQLLTESALLACAGSALGLLLLAGLFRVVLYFNASDTVSFGWMTIAWTIPVTIVAAVLFGLSPALHATRASVADVLKSTSQGGARTVALQRKLVVAHVALSQPLLIGLGVVLATTLNNNSPPGRAAVAGRTAVASIALRPHTRDSAGTTSAIIREALAGLPGVERVADAVSWNSRDLLELPPAERGDGPMANDAFRARIRPVGAGYFALLNIRVIAGREFDRTDARGTPTAAIIASDLARELWGTSNPIGRTLRRRNGNFNYTIVGVVDADYAGDSFEGGLARVFVATAQLADMGLAQDFYVRSATGGAALVPAIRARLAEVPAGVTVYAVQTLADIDAAARRENLVTGLAASGGGLLALLIGSVGLYAIVAFSVAQRAREIGIRVALGAGRRRIIAHFARDGVKLSLIGIAIGLPASVFAVRAFMQNIGVAPYSEWGSAFVVAFAVTAVSMLATWIPARRAARVDPMIACRAD
jgi:predicted permease